MVQEELPQLASLACPWVGVGVPYLRRRQQRQRWQGPLPRIHLPGFTVTDTAATAATAMGAALLEGVEAKTVSSTVVAVMPAAEGILAAVVAGTLTTTTTTITRGTQTQVFAAASALVALVVTVLVSVLGECGKALVLQAQTGIDPLLEVLSLFMSPPHPPTRLRNPQLRWLLLPLTPWVQPRWRWQAQQVARAAPRAVGLVWAELVGHPRHSSRIATPRPL
mmetsp:Transcript_81652/g.162989  ORF Transcript_81652/g.162989 Transcript_81652/m.162989 type:complete len:222 (+) Transcript_81652:971-1636(+)